MISPLSLVVWPARNRLRWHLAIKTPSRSRILATPEALASPQKRQSPSEAFAQIPFASSSPRLWSGSESLFEGPIRRFFKHI